MGEPGVVLLYRGTCAKCRCVSRLIAILSLNAVERVPFNSARAESYLRLHPQARGKLVLQTAAGPAIGSRAIAPLVGLILRAWLRL